MMPPSLRHPSSRRFDIALTVVGLLGLLLFLLFYDQAFPSAALNLKLSRSEIAQRAEQYLKAQGHDVTGYEFALDFDEDGAASLYLQRTLGVPETNRLVKAENLPIWYWSARWFKPHQEEEFSLSLLPDGKIVGFNHTIAEADPGAALSQAEARVIAENYLTIDQGMNLADWETTSASSQTKPGGRIDHLCEWKRHDFAIGEGDVRRAVEVQGDRVGYGRYWLRTPEAFLRQFSEQRNLPNFINDLCFMVGFGVFGGLAAVAAFSALARGVLSWRIAMTPVLLVGLVTLLARLNDLPVYKFYYDTTSDYTLFWLENISSALFSAIYNALFVFMLWVGGVALAKKAWPRRDTIIPRGQDRRIGLAKSTYRGLMLGGFQFGYTTLFYLLAVQLFGSWVPLQPPGSLAPASPLPFIDPIYIGLIPATQEELLFRLIGIGLVLLLSKRRWLALLIPAALWGFAHLSYIRDPFYFRGIELTIAGVIDGLFFLRFGLVTTIAAHYMFNAGLTALPLLRSREPWYLLSGLIVVGTMLAPIVLGALRWFRIRQQIDPLRSAPAPHPAMASRADLAGLQTLAIAHADWPAWFDDPTRVSMCLKSGDKIIGVVMGRVLNDRTVDIMLTYVAPEWRRQYWGTTLIDQFKVIARDSGLKDLQTVVDVRDDTSIAFWASQSWKPRRRVYTVELMEEVKAAPKRWWKRLGVKIEKKLEFLM